MMYAIAWSAGSGSYLPLVRVHAVLEDLLERTAADVLHDDVAGAVEAREVVDLEDERVLHLGEELAFGDGRFERVLVAGVQQPLEHDVPVGDVVVAGQVDPAEPAVRDAADDVVLTSDDDRPRAASARTSTAYGTSGRTLRCARCAVTSTRPTGAPHAEQKRFSSRTDGFGEDDGLRVGDRRGGNVGDAGAEVLHAVCSR